MNSRQLTLTDMWGRTAGNNNIGEENLDLKIWNEQVELHKNDLSIISINIGDRIQNKVQYIQRYIKNMSSNISFM